MGLVLVFGMQSSLAGDVTNASLVAPSFPPSVPPVAELNEAEQMQLSKALDAIGMKLDRMESQRQKKTDARTKQRPPATNAAY